MTGAIARRRFGAALQEQIRRAALVVDKVLRGARPADIPVEQPTRFGVTLNGRSARAPGIALPKSVLLLADEVID